VAKSKYTSGSGVLIIGFLTQEVVIMPYNKMAIIVVENNFFIRK
jgi:hypothetical protein